MSPPPPGAVPPTRVLLVRHGQSEWNAEGRWQGQADPPLTDLGRLQAREAAGALGTVDAVWASDLQRAVETAAIIADQLGVGPVVVDPDLRERDAGEFSGLTRPEIAARFPGYLDDGRRPPGWEPDEALLARALRALHAIAAEVPGGDVHDPVRNSKRAHDPLFDGQDQLVLVPGRVGPHEREHLDLVEIGESRMGRAEHVEVLEDRLSQLVDHRGRGARRGD